MSTDQPELTDAPDEVPMPTPVEADAILQFIVSLANDVDGFEMGVTLFTPSGPVSGILTGIDKWFDAWEQMVKEGSTGHSFVEGLNKTLAERRSELPPQTQDTIRYVHLTGAHFISGGQMVPVSGQPGLLWRGQLTDVSGWSPVKMSLPPRD
ncbi:hypothetical protein OG218_00940 [Kineococcus sp. NBC_00420]|uniref:hypothetical protein n=1 Tax=Kineococcus sp. NBC_00420 TaxID=2903564 RepID=UPI002E1D9FD1